MRVSLLFTMKPNNYTESYMVNVADRWSERMCEYPRRSAWKASKEVSNVARHC